MRIKPLILEKKRRQESCTPNINYEDIKKQKICEHFGKILQLYKETLFTNLGNKKRCYDDINEEKIDGNNTEKIEELLSEEYLLKNDDKIDEKCNVELDFEDIKKSNFWKQ